MRHTKNLLVLGLALIGASALAQTPPPPDGPNRGPADGPAHRPPRPANGGMRLLLDPKVRAELRLTDEQVAKIRTFDPHPGEPPKGGPGAGPDGERPEGGPPRPGAAAPNGAAPQGGPEERLRAILEPDQWNRFRQIRLQREGARAILRPDVAKELGLTDEQIGRMRPTPPAPQTDGVPVGPPVAGERPDPRKDDARILSMLTEAQRAKWQTMLGRPFESARREDARPVPPPGDAPADKP